MNVKMTAPDNDNYLRGTPGAYISDFTGRPFGFCVSSM